MRPLDTEGGAGSGRGVLRQPVRQHAPRTIQPPDVILLVLFALLILVAVFVGWKEPSFWALSNMANMMRQGAIFSLLAWGQALALIAGGVDLSVASAAALSGVIFALLAGSIGTGAAIVPSVIVGLNVGLANGVAIAYLGVPSFIATLATRSVARGLALVATGGVAFYGVPGDFQLIASADLAGIPVPFWISLAIFLGSLFILQRMALGRSMYAVGANAQAARLSGLNVPRIRIIAHGLSGACAGLAGVILASRVNSGQPAAAGGLELEALAAVILGGVSLFGGRGKLVGVAAGVAFVTVLTNALNFLDISPYVRMMTVGTALLVGVALDILLRRRWGS